MEELIEGLRKAESEEIELKKSTSQLERALKAICAFLNHKGGKVYFGIAPDRKIVGQEVSDQTLKTISQKIRQKIKPEINPEIKVLEIEGRKITIFSPEGYEYVGLYLNERQRKALEYIKEKGKITRREYIELTKVSQRQANKDIDILIKENLIVRYGKGRSVYYSLRT